MVGILYVLFFYSVPIGLIVLFFVSLFRYISAKKQNNASPSTFADVEIQKRKIILIVISVVTGVITAIVIGFMILMFMAIAYM